MPRRKEPFRATRLAIPWETRPRYSEWCIKSWWPLIAEYINETMKASAEYISVGANRSSSCAVCSGKGQVAFGAGRYVALWDSEVCIQPSTWLLAD
jgi:sugar (pentulose or hexulose) kinase